MKRDPSLGRVVERMAPGILCRDGFLAPDPRPLEEVLDADRSALSALGISPEELAAGLRCIYELARAALGTPLPIGALIATHRDAMGRIPCPWGGCGTFPKGEAELADPATGQTLILTALGLHMLAAHGFCGGRGSRFRLDPATAARLLRLATPPD